METMLRDGAGIVYKDMVKVFLGKHKVSPIFRITR